MITGGAKAWRPTLVRHGVLRPPIGIRPDLLVLPERVVRLSPSAAAILFLCTGERTVREITRDVEQLYGRDDLAGEVGIFLARVAELGWVR